MHFVQREAGTERVADVPQPLRARRRQFLAYARARRLAVIVTDHRIEAVAAGFEAAQGLVQGFLEIAADRHRLADRLHLRGQSRIRLREFFEGETRHLGDHVVDRGLERGRRHAAGDVVAQFVQGVAHRQLGRDLGDRKTGGLGRQRRGPRHARIHFDDDDAAVIRIDRELHIGAAGVDADLAQHRHRGVAQQLVLLVGQRLCRRHRDRITGVHAHRIEVLDRADDDAIVLVVAHHLHLELFPAEQGFLDQDFIGRRQVEAAQHDFLEFLDVVGNAAAGAAHRETGADDHRKADVRLDLARLIHRVRHRRTGRAESNLGHRIAKLLAILRQIDRLFIGADQFHAVFLENPVFGQIQCAIECRLPAHGRQHRVRALLVDDAFQGLPADRLDVGRIGHLRVGHDRRRIGGDQDDPVALLAQRLAGLGARIVEFAGLADDDGAGADDEDTVDVGALRHGGS